MNRAYRGEKCHAPRTRWASVAVSPVQPPLAARWVKYADLAAATHESKQALCRLSLDSRSS